MAGSTSRQPEKTANIWRCFHWFPLQMTFEKWAQKFHTDEASLSRSGWCFRLVVLGGKFDSASERHYPDLVSDTSSVWNFCAHFSNVIWRGNQWWCCQVSFHGETNGGVVKCWLFSQANEQAKSENEQNHVLWFANGPVLKKGKNSVVLKFVKVWATSKLIINDLLESASNPHMW